MRLDPKLVHPSIFKATDAATWSGMGGDTKASAEHSRVWMQQYGMGCGGWFLGAVTLFIGSGVLMKAFEVDKPLRVAVMLTMLVAFFIAGAFATFRHMRRLSVRELEAMLPALKLTPTQQAYAETIIALEGSGNSQEDVQETMRTLNTLLDEADRLETLRGRLVSTDRGKALFELQEERRSIAERQARTTDPVAHEAYAQSLSLLDERLAAHQTSEAGSERIDAHLELLRQAVFATRDAARRVGSAPRTSVELETDALRAAVSQARAQTQASEQALAELNAI